jgi:hypothetical protein
MSVNGSIIFSTHQNYEFAPALMISRYFELSTIQEHGKCCMMVLVSNNASTTKRLELVVLVVT